MRRIQRPSPAVVLAMIALTVSLTGTGFAFGQVPAINGRQRRRPP